MTVSELSIRYNIDVNKLKLFENNKLISLKDEYSTEELEEMSMLCTLYDCGFTADKLKCYMDSKEAGNCLRQLDLLNEQRYALLDEIHVKQKLLDKLDYIIYNIKNSKR